MTVFTLSAKMQWRDNLFISFQFYLSSRVPKSDAYKQNTVKGRIYQNMEMYFLPIVKFLFLSIAGSKNRAAAQSTAYWNSVLLPLNNVSWNWRISEQLQVKNRELLHVWIFWITLDTHCKIRKATFFWQLAYYEKKKSWKCTQTLSMWCMFEKGKLGQSG